MSLSVSPKIPQMELRLQANIDTLRRQKETLEEFREAIFGSNDPEKRLRTLEKFSDWEVKSLQDLYQRGCIIAPLVNETLISSIHSILSSSMISIESQNEKCELEIQPVLQLLAKKINVFQR